MWKILQVRTTPDTAAGDNSGDPSAVVFRNRFELGVLVKFPA